MEYLHTMVRVEDLDASLSFYVDALGLVETRRFDAKKGRFTLVYLAAPDQADMAKEHKFPELELTYNWPDEDGNRETYSGGRNFGHMAFRVNDIYAVCERLQKAGVTINRPPRDPARALGQYGKYWRVVNSLAHSFASINPAHIRKTELQ